MTKGIAQMEVRSASRRRDRLAREFVGDDPEVKFTIRIPESLRVQLKSIAAHKRTSVQKLIIAALRAAYPDELS